MSKHDKREIKSIYDWPIADKDAHASIQALHAKKEELESNYNKAIHEIEREEDIVRGACKDPVHQAKKYRPYYCPSCDRMLR